MTRRISSRRSQPTPATENRPVVGRRMVVRMRIAVVSPAPVYLIVLGISKL